ncbi:MAG: hypothetical protein Ct9H300mP28_28250 [Pseudomonadota bacterium]|nr:MAG: hypothetical protein Ct9H300mP28_28250 [Pseudomonadota bacterium]
MLFCQKPLRWGISSQGFQNHVPGVFAIVLLPTCHPASAIVGLREVKGAATNAAAIVIGWPNAAAFQGGKCAVD